MDHPRRPDSLQCQLRRARTNAQMQKHKRSMRCVRPACTGLRSVCPSARTASTAMRHDIKTAAIVSTTVIPNIGEMTCDAAR